MTQTLLEMVEREFCVSSRKNSRCHSLNSAGIVDGSTSGAIIFRLEREGEGRDCLLEHRFTLRNRTSFIWGKK
jgi:hypothetical protein